MNQQACLWFSSQTGVTLNSYNPKPNLPTNFNVDSFKTKRLQLVEYELHRHELSIARLFYEICVRKALWTSLIKMYFNTVIYYKPTACL